MSPEVLIQARELLVDAVLYIRGRTDRHPAVVLQVLECPDAAMAPMPVSQYLHRCSCQRFSCAALVGEQVRREGVLGFEMLLVLLEALVV